MNPKRSLAAMLCLFVLSLNAQTISYNWLDKIGLAKEMLRTVKLEHSKKTVTYTKKIRIPKAKGKSKSLPRRQAGKQKSRIIVPKFTDYAWKEAALVVMDADNGNLEIAKIKKDGQRLVNTNPKFDISIEERSSGLTWNGKNTAFTVISNESNSIYTVIANKWLERLADGRVKEHVYAPFSNSLYQQELIASGEAHLKDDVRLALGQLGVWGVGSLVFPKVTLASVVPADYLYNIALNEQTDPQEFYAFLAGDIKYDPFKRVLVLLAANGEEAYAETKSNADALGPHQFTEPTWNLMKKTYPDAKLFNFRDNAGNHLVSSRATALLYDYNLAELVRVFGNKILRDKNLTMYIAAAHNCGVSRVIKALKKPGKNWRVALRKLGKTDETILFLEKMDYLLKPQLNQ